MLRGTLGKRITVTENTKDSGKQPSLIHDRTADGVTISPRAELLKRTSKASTWSPALAEVQFKLAVSTELYESFSDEGQVGTRSAMEAIIDYFVSVGIARNALKPLMNVICALDEAKMGIHNPTFKEMKTGHRGRRRGDQDRALEGLLAAVTECCFLHCKGQGGAYAETAGRLAEKMVRESALGMKPSPSWQRLITLREQVTAREAASTERQAYDRLVPILEGVEPLEFAKSVLATPWGPTA